MNALKIFCAIIIAMNLIACSNSENKKPTVNYVVLRDDSDARIDKNSLIVELPNKVSEKDIKQLAEYIYGTKPKQKRFYISYLLPGMKIDAGAWATSHFDPDLKIDIIGATIEQDIYSDSLAKSFSDDLVGLWQEQRYNWYNYLIYKKNGAYHLTRVFHKDIISEGRLKKIDDGRYLYEGEDDESLYINKSGQLELSTKERGNYSTALKVL